MAMSWPRRASARTMARPIRREAPVTSAAPRDASVNPAELERVDGGEDNDETDDDAEGQHGMLLFAGRHRMRRPAHQACNASVFEDDRVGSLSRETWDRHLETNLRAPLVLIEAFAAQAPDGSAVVNLLDQRVLKPDPRFVSYALSRNGLWWATRTMAQALAPRIRVNGVGPGPTLKSIHQTEEEFAAEAASVPLGHGAEPGDIAAAVLYLVDARSVTGQMIAVDGGQHLAWRTPDIPADD